MEEVNSSSGHVIISVLREMEKRLCLMLVNGNMNTYLLTGLIPNTEYKVAVSSTFRDKFESDTVTIKESTADALFSRWFPSRGHTGTPTSPLPSCPHWRTLSGRLTYSSSRPPSLSQGL